MINDQNTQVIQALSEKPGTYRRYSAVTGSANAINVDRNKYYLVTTDQDLYYMGCEDPADFDVNDAQVLFARSSMIFGSEFSDYLVVQARTADTDVRLVEVR